MSNFDTVKKIENIKYKKSLEATKKLFQRILPEKYDNFLITIDESIKEDIFYLRSCEKKIEIRANNPVNIASGLNWYLKHYCNSHLSWRGNQINLHNKLPLPIEEISYKAKFNYRYYLNYCTFSYSMPWWNWKRWEREIDMMALNGINYVLSLIGQEAVWQNFMLKYGFTQTEILEFLPGPAFLAWGWLGNLDGWGGATTQNWIDDQKELQKKIIGRLTELNITPILQAFTGRVPKAFIEKFPDAKIEQLPGWYGYEGIYFLDPSDSLFNKLSKEFIEEQTKLYGNYHYFAGDVFHEIDSPLTNIEYLNNIYKGIEEGLIYADKKAKWVIQSWSVRDESLKKLDGEKVLMLDLFCDKEPKWKNTKAFHGLPWVWTVINNFGGRTGVGGNINLIAKEIPQVLSNKDKGNLVGLGFAPEGIGNSPIVFDLLMEMNWRDEIENLEEWVYNFAQRRYGYFSENIKLAWKGLLETAYSGPETYPPLETVVCAYPSLNIEKAGSNGSTKIYYNNNILQEVLNLLLKEQERLKNSETYLFDIVDIARQVCANHLNELYVEIVKSIEEKNVSLLEKISEQFFSLTQELDVLLNSNEFFSLGKWLADAKSKAKDQTDLKLLEWNARRQITLWSSPEITEFHDYANKQWGGLIADYYLPRWKKFVEMQIESINKGLEFDTKSFKEKMLNWAEQWSNKNDVYPIINGKSSIKLIEKIIDKVLITR